jgi:hypothetical protein
MSTTAIPAEILHLESADPPEAGPGTKLEPRPEEEHVEERPEPDDRRGDVDDLPRVE